MSDIENLHSTMVRKLVKKPEEIIKNLDCERMHLLHMASKLCSEAGELMDAVGKLCYYNKPLDRENIIEELGDIEFYLEGLRSYLALFRNETLQANMNKLSKRYPSWQYSDANAQARKDKQ